MSARVAADEILSIEAYVAGRSERVQAIIAAKEPRRIHVGEYLAFLFENHATVLFQVQEMCRVEDITNPADVQHELDTYNALLGNPGDLGCTLQIEIDDILQRDIVLRKWIDLPKHIYLMLDNGQRARARYDEAQVGDDKLSSVQFLLFRCGGAKPVAIGLDMPDMSLESPLTPEQLGALAADLAAWD